MILLKNKNKKANIKIGNNIEIKDGSDFPFDLTLYGRSTQETTTGKNLLNNTLLTTITEINGITATPNSDGSVKLNGTALGIIYINLSRQDFGTKNIISGSISGTYTAITGTNVAGVNLEYNGTNKYTYIRVANATTLSNVIIYPMIILSSITDDTYEPYTGGQPSPNPDYPSPIESVGRKNLFDVNSITENTYLIASTGGTGSSSVSNISDYIFVKANQPYYLSYSYTSLLDTSYRSLCYYDTNKNFISGISIDPTSFHTFTPTQDGYIRFTYDKNYTNIQLEKGHATDYVPYDHTEISATVTGKNLFDGVIEAGYININTGQNIGSINVRTKNYIPIQPNTQYTISSDTSHDTLACYYDNNFSFISNQQIKSNTSGTFTTPNNAYYIRWYDSLSTGETPEWQLEKGTATPYEEYKSNSLTIDLQGNELCSLPNGTKDEVNITNGKASIVKNGNIKIIKKTKQIVLDGSEDWIYDDTYKYFRCPTYNFGAQIPIFGENQMSNHFTITTSWITFRDSTNQNLMYAVQDTAYKVCIRNINCTTVDDFKSWLSTHNVEVLYELAEPETINLGTVEMPHTYNGVSNITNSADTAMVVKYYKKFEFDKILRSGYNIDEQEYEITKKQIANGKRKKI